MSLPGASWLDVSMIYFRKEDFVTLAALFFSAPENIVIVSDSRHPAGAEVRIEHWKKLIFFSIIVSSFLYPFASCIRS